MRDNKRTKETELRFYRPTSRLLLAWVLPSLLFSLTFGALAHAELSPLAKELDRVFFTPGADLETLIPVLRQLEEGGDPFKRAVLKRAIKEIETHRGSAFQALAAQGRDAEEALTAAATGKAWIEGERYLARYNPYRTALSALESLQTKATSPSKPTPSELHVEGLKQAFTRVPDAFSSQGSGRGLSDPLAEAAYQQGSLRAELNADIAKPTAKQAPLDLFKKWRQATYQKFRNDTIELTIQAYAQIMRAAPDRFKIFAEVGGNRRELTPDEWLAFERREIAPESYAKNGRPIYPPSANALQPKDTRIRLTIDEPISDGVTRPREIRMEDVAHVRWRIGDSLPVSFDTGQRQALLEAHILTALASEYEDSRATIFTEGAKLFPKRGVQGLGTFLLDNIAHTKSQVRGRIAMPPLVGFSLEARSAWMEPAIAVQARRQSRIPIPPLEIDPEHIKALVDEELKRLDQQGQVGRSPLFSFWGRHKPKANRRAISIGSVVLGLNLAALGISNEHVRDYLSRPQTQASASVLKIATGEATNVDTEAPASRQPLLRFKAREGTPLPTRLALVDPSGSLEKATEIRPSGKLPRFETETRMALPFSANANSPIATYRGRELADLKITDAKSGSVLVPQRDYKVYLSEFGEVFVRPMPGSTVKAIHAQAAFGDPIPDAQKNTVDPRLQNLSSVKILEYATALEEDGYTARPKALRELVDRAKRNKQQITHTDFDRVLTITAEYETRPKVGWVMPWNLSPMSRSAAKFVDASGVSRYQCTGAQKDACIGYETILEDESDLRLIPRTILKLPEGTEGEIVAGHVHADALIASQRAILAEVDTTPSLNHRVDRTNLPAPRSKYQEGIKTLLAAWVEASQVLPAGTAPPERNLPPDRGSAPPDPATTQRKVQSWQREQSKAVADLEKTLIQKLAEHGLRESAYADLTTPAGRFFVVARNLRKHLLGELTEDELRASMARQLLEPPPADEPISKAISRIAERAQKNAASRHIADNPWSPFPIRAALSDAFASLTELTDRSLPPKRSYQRVPAGDCDALSRLATTSPR